MKRKILVIEDEKTTLNSIVEFLLSEGFDAIGSENGRKGIELAQKHLPDLIICDILMPELDGYDVLTYLQQDAETAAIPFIFLTATTDSSSFRLGMEMGADDYLRKPVTSAELRAAIASRLRKQEATENGYLSLSTTLIELQNSYDQLVLEHKQILNEAELVKQKHEYSEQRYQQVLTQNAVLTNQIKQEQQHNTECRINLAQKEVDLAKQDNQILMLEEQNAKLVKQVEELQRQKAQAEAKSWQKMAEKLDSLSSSLKSLSAKDRGSKQ